MFDLSNEHGSSVLGVCFVAEDPKKEHLQNVFSEASAEAIIYKASA
jgi:hypothetical protein